jgi:hypothetical protein
MSVSCRILVGLTLEFERDIDFGKVDKFTDKHPELDEYNYRFDDKEGRLLLIGDGYNGDFLRLIQVDKIIEDGSLGDSNDFIPLNMPVGTLNQELIRTMSELYKEYTGEYPKNSDFKYAMWSQWS